MKRRNFPTVAVTAVLLILYAVITMPGCISTEEPAPQPVSEAVPETESETEPEFESAEEPSPLDIEWGGTAWILPDLPDKSAKEFPGYRGFYLGIDGRLLLLNLDNAAGDNWSVEGNRISLSILEGNPVLPLEGTFFIFPGASAGTAENDEVMSIRLVPEAMPAADGIALNRVMVNIDIIENHWIPKRLKGGEEVMWPMNREIHMMLLPVAAGLEILGYGGDNRFQGSIQLSSESFLVGPLSMTRRFGPAFEFEYLYLQRISEANRYVQAGNDLFLYTDTHQVAAFRAEFFD